MTFSAAELMVTEVELSLKAFVQSLMLDHFGQTQVFVQDAKPLSLYMSCGTVFSVIAYSSQSYAVINFRIFQYA